MKNRQIRLHTLYQLHLQFDYAIEQQRSDHQLPEYFYPTSKTDYGMFVTFRGLVFIRDGRQWMYKHQTYIFIKEVLGKQARICKQLSQLINKIRIEQLVYSL